MPVSLALFSGIRFPEELRNPSIPSRKSASLDGWSPLTIARILLKLSLEKNLISRRSRYSGSNCLNCLIRVRVCSDVSPKTTKCSSPGCSRMARSILFLRSLRFPKPAHPFRKASSAGSSRSTPPKITGTSGSSRSLYLIMKRVASSSTVTTAPYRRRWKSRLRERSIRSLSSSLFLYRELRYRMSISTGWDLTPLSFSRRRAPRVTESLQEYP